MASNVEITISQLPLPELAELRALANEHGLDLDSADDFGERNHSHIYIGFWDRKWGVNNSFWFAKAISRKYPYLRVSLVEVWDARDADEAGGEAFELRAGEITSKGRIEWVWTQVDKVRVSQ